MPRAAVLVLTVTCILAPPVHADITSAPGHAVFSIATPDIATGGVIAVDDAIFVGQGTFGAGSQRVIRLDAEGVTPVAGGFNAIGGMAYDAASDTLFVTDNGGDQPGATTGDTVYAVPAARTRSVAAAAETVELLPPGSIPNAADVIVEPTGTLLVGDAAGGETGAVLRVNGPTATRLVGGLGFTAGLAIMPGGATILVGEVDSATFAGSVSEYRLDGTFERTLVAGLSGAFDQVFDDRGTLLVTGGFTPDFSSSTVIAIAPDGTATTFASGFSFSAAIDFATATQTAYVLDSGVPEITVICRDADGDRHCDAADVCDDHDDCDDGDPCTTGTCTPAGRCINTPTDGVGGLRCFFDSDRVPLPCVGQTVPPRVGRLVDRALRRLDRVETGVGPRNAVRLTRRARRFLKRADRVVGRAATRKRNPIPEPCAGELRDLIESAREAARSAVPPAGQNGLAVILTSDLASTGAYSTITLDLPRVVRTDLGTTHSDAVGRFFGGRIYVVNRLGQDNVQVIDPRRGRSLSACSIGNGTNPQDIAFANPNKAYVTRFRDSTVSIVDPTVPQTCNGFKRGRIDLSRFADADGVAELGHMLIVDDLLYVAILRLDRNHGFAPAGPGLVALIDTETDTLLDANPDTPELDALELSGSNPFGMAHDVTTNKIWVWEAGSLFVTGDGGIETIDPVARRTEGFIASETALGGTVTAAAPYTAERAFAIVAGEDFRNSLVAFSPSSGELLDTLRSTPSYLPGLAVNDRGEVWLADRTLAAPGIRIFEAASGQPLAGPIDVGLPPVGILFAPAQMPAS